MKDEQSTAGDGDWTRGRIPRCRSESAAAVRTGLLLSDRDRLSACNHSL
jgi:hypothetical protein